MKRKLMSLIMVFMMIINMAYPIISVGAEGVAENGAVEDRTLYFNLDDGEFYSDELLGAKITDEIPKDKWEWDSETRTLTVKGLSWETTADSALYLCDDSDDGDPKSVTLYLEAGTVNTFVSTSISDEAALLQQQVKQGQ